MKFPWINPNILLLLAFALTYLAGMINPQIAQGCHAHGGNSRDLVGCSSPSHNQRLVSPNSNYFTKIVVNFVSIGSGIDKDTEQKLFSFVESEYPQVKYSEKRWRREGEITYVFSVESLSPQARKDFLTSIQQIVEQGKFINLTIGDEKGVRL